VRLASTLLALGFLFSIATAQSHDKTIQAQAAPTSARVALEQMSLAERKNSSISVEFETSDSAAILLGHEVERLWNGGHCDLALSQLDSLEARVGHVAIGNSWRKPVPTIDKALWGGDVRIGNRDSLLGLAIDYDFRGCLLAALRHGHGPEGFSVCRSSDQGATWAETFAWFGSQVTSLDAVVLFPSFFYVAYHSPGEDAQQVRLRRFLVSDGSANEFDVGSWWVAACTLDLGDTAREVSLVTGVVNLYITTILSDGSLGLSWDSGGDASWHKLPTGVDSGASRGLDCNWRWGGPIGGYLLLSYLDATDTLRILRWVSSGFAQRFAHYCGPSELTSLDGYGDRVVCAYEDGTFSPRRVCCALSYDSAATWTTATLSDTEVAAEAPAIAMYGPGFGAVFRHDSPTPELRFRLCPDSWPWSDPVSISDNTSFSGRPVIKHLSYSQLYHSDLFAVAHMSDTSPVVRGAYFVRDWVYGIAEQRRAQAASRASLATLVRGVLFLPKMGTVPSGTVPTFGPSLVDMSGRKVLDLHPGANDVRRLAPGVYFVREAQAQAQAIRKVIVTR